MALWLVDGRSGKIKRRTPIASSDSLGVVGDTFYLFDGLNRGTISAYTIHELFSSSGDK